MSDRVVYFAGVTGPGASEGPMAIAYVLMEEDLPIARAARFLAAGYDTSWHSATYHALALALEHCSLGTGPRPVFATDNEMVVSQMKGARGVKGGHYVEAREDAIEALVRQFPTRGDRVDFKWIPLHENPAVPLCRGLLEEHGIEPWTYKKRLAEPTAVLEDGTEIPWEEVKSLALRDKVKFRVAGDRNEIEFHLHPDFFPGSYVLAWTTAPERAGAPYLDCRCRSNNPDDFLSRIASLVATRPPPPYARRT